DGGRARRQEDALDRRRRNQATRPAPSAPNAPPLEPAPTMRQPQLLLFVSSAGAASASVDAGCAAWGPSPSSATGVNTTSVGLIWFRSLRVQSSAIQILRKTL